MNQRCSSHPEREATGLGAVILQALQSVASKEATDGIVRAALDQAGLRKLPEDPVVLLAFLSGALHKVASAKLGEEFGDALLADAAPILERAAAHAVAVEEAPADGAGVALFELDEEPPAHPAGDVVVAPSAAAGAEERLPTPPEAEQRSEGAPAFRPSRARGRSTKPGVGRRGSKPAVGSHASKPARAAKGRQTDPGVGASLSSRPAVVRKRHTAPGIAIDVDVTSDAAEAAKTPRRSVMPAPRRPTQDPRRLTLGYEAVVDDPAVGHGSRPCALVAMTDPTLRAVVARILRREGFGVVTAPEGSLGAVLAERFDAAILVVDSRGAPRTSGDVPSELLPPMIWLDVEPDNPPALASDARALRLAAKPLDPSSLVSAIEQLMPAGWRG